MRNISMYIDTLKRMAVISPVALNQATGQLVKVYSIKETTANRAINLIFNGSKDENGNVTPPLLKLSSCRTFFIDI